jgi:DMSO/TMAO reductase YedYZ molybdopterin-dependent catalytic subunit
MGVESTEGAPVDRVEGAPVGRRVVLGMLGLGTAGVLFGSRAADALSRLLAPVTAADPTGLSSLVPAAGGFRIYSVVGFLPKKADADYRLRVTGLVDRPVTLTLADLESMTPTSLTKDFQCVTGWRVRDVPWVGVQLSEVLAAAGVQPAARAVRFHSFDNVYTETLTLTQARRPDVLVAYTMQDRRIPARHGGPVRLYVAPMYGYKSLKWLDEIEVVADRADDPGYWEVRGYDTDAWIGRSNGRDDAPV